MRLEDITEGSIVMGIVPHEPVTVVTTKWHGTACLDVFYKTNRGQTGERVVFREDEELLEVVQRSLPWSFDVGGDKMRLVSEAYRIQLAHLFDPYLAVHTFLLLTHFRTRSVQFMKKCCRVCRFAMCWQMPPVLAKQS